jgi:hypothetical protein
MSAFSYKLTTETEQFTFDFSTVLGTGETISSASMNVEVIQGTDSSPLSILVGSPVINGSRVAQRITGGLDEVTYRLELTINTSASNVYTLLGDLPVLAPLSV